MDPPCKTKDLEALFYGTLVIQPLKSISTAEGVLGAGRSRRRGKPRAAGPSGWAWGLQDHKKRWFLDCSNPNVPTAVRSWICGLSAEKCTSHRLTNFMHLLSAPGHEAGQLGNMPVDSTHCLARAHSIKRAFVDDSMNRHIINQSLQPLGLGCRKPGSQTCGPSYPRCVGSVGPVRAMNWKRLGATGE